MQDKIVVIDNLRCYVVVKVAECGGSVLVGVFGFCLIVVLVVVDYGLMIGE